MIPPHTWPAHIKQGSLEWDAEHGDRRTEIVWIGRELDHDAARLQLEACLLTAEEMATGPEAWLAMPDPLTGGKRDWHGAHGHTGSHAADDVAAHDELGGVTEANLREMMEAAIKQVQLPHVQLLPTSHSTTCTCPPPQPLVLAQ